MLTNPQNSPSAKKERVVLEAQDLRIVLDEISLPCVVFNFISKRILTLNYQFADFSKYAVSEIIGENIESVVNEIPFRDIPDGYIGEAVISRKKDNAVRSKIEFRYINQSEHLALVTVILDSGKELVRDLWKSLTENQLRILENVKNMDKESLFSEFVRMGESVFAADYSMLYKQVDNKGGLEKFSVDENNFPEKIPLIELKRINEIDYWEPGKRVLTEIHRAARFENIHHLFSFPLEFSNGVSGIYVVAYRDGKDFNSVRNIFPYFKQWLQYIEGVFSTFNEIDAENDRIQYRNEVLEVLIENISDSILILNAEGEIVSFNSKFCGLFSYSPVEILNTPFEKIFGRRVTDLLNSSEIIESEEDQRNIVLLRDRNGNEMPVFMDQHELIINQNKLLLLIIQSASDYLDHTKNLLDLEKKAVLGEVIADFAHEVRNPINNIATGLQLVDQQLSEGDSKKEAVGRMQEDCFRMNYLMESILSFSRQQAESVSEVDLKALIARTVMRMNTKVEKAGHTLNFHCSLSSPLAKVDRRSFEQVLINLINNSLDALEDEQGIISVSLTESKDPRDYYQIVIADTGRGIPEEIEKKLFEPFVSDKPAGTGLGLAISKRIIESHNGFIRVDSFAGGTIFNIFLPKTIQGEQS